MDRHHQVPAKVFVLPIEWRISFWIMLWIYRKARPTPMIDFPKHPLARSSFHDWPISRDYLVINHNRLTMVIAFVAFSTPPKGLTRLVKVGLQPSLLVFISPNLFSSAFQSGSRPMTKLMTLWWENVLWQIPTTLHYTIVIFIYLNRYRYGRILKPRYHLHGSLNFFS